MRKTTKFIFDLDGTLYQFSPGQSHGFERSVFYADLKQRVLNFIASEFNLSANRALDFFHKVDAEFAGELSIGFEKKYGIDRHRYFAATWDCLPKTYMQRDARLAEALAPLSGRALLLTNAPRIWADRTLAHLGVADIFDHIITGEPDIRKPDPQVFVEAAAMLGADPTDIVSVGDQNHSDIVPAKSVGMATVLIGPEQQAADFRADDIYHALRVIKENKL